MPSNETPSLFSGRRAALALLPVVLLLALPATAPTPLLGEAAPFDAGLLAGLRARSIGPAVMSGRVTAIEGVASDPRTIYAGGASGGVWKTVDGGIAWTPVFDDQPVASIGAIAVFQKSPDVVWVGTGEGNVRNSASVGNGVYRSLDGGKTWSQLGLDATERIARIVLHPDDPDVAWVAALGREWGENPERGVFKTEDGGKTWKKVLYIDEKTGAADLVIDPGNPRRLLAAMWQFRRWPWQLKSGGPGSGLYATYDGGRTWKRRTEDDGLPKGELGRINLAQSRSNPEVVYAAVEAGQSALLRSADGGRSWAAVNRTPNIAPRPFYFAELAVDPQWPNRVYSLGFDIRVSDDSGKTFGNLYNSALIHGDYHAIWIDPNDPRHLLVGDDGGIAVSYDRGRTAAFIANLPLGQYYHVAVDMETPYNVYGGLQDNGSWRGPSSTWEAGGIPNSAWTLIGGGDGFGTLPDPDDAAAGYSLSQNGFVTRWDLRTGEIKDARPADPEGVRLRFNWNTGIAIDPFAPGTVYLGSQFVHKSTDRGRSWNIISPDLTTNNPAWQHDRDSGGLTPDSSGAETYTSILAIAPSPVARGVIWVGTDDGRVQVTRDGGASWTSVEGNVHGVPANTWVPEIRASRFAAGTAFAVFDDHRRSNWTTYVQRTDDFGKTWKSLATPELRGYAHTVEQDAVDPALLFLGTEQGLWISNDGGAHWLRWKHGLPTAPVMGLAVQPRDRDLVIATHGRALYVLDDIRPLSGLGGAVLGEPLHLFPAGGAQQHWQRSNASGYGRGSGEYFGANRPYGALITFSVSGDGIPLADEDRERERKERERAAATARAAAAPEQGEAKPAAATGGGAHTASQASQASQAARTGQPGTQEAPAAPGSGAAERATTPAAPAAATGTTGTTGTTGARGAAAAGRAAGAGGAGSGAKEEEPPKAQIEVADASGRTLRHFKVPVTLGINRAAWGFERDDWKEAPPGPDQPPQEDPAGPEVPPGHYTVKVKFRGHEASTTVQVLPDPRSHNSAADWQQRWAAISRAGSLQQAAAEAIERIARIRADVASAVAKAKEAKEAREAKEAAGANREAAAAQPPQAAAGNDTGASPLAGAADRLEQGLADLEKRLWHRPDLQGLLPPDDLIDQITIVQGALTSQWDPPSPTQLEGLRQAGDHVERFLDDFNRFSATDLAAFRKQAAEAKVGLLAEEPPLAVAKP
jgi:photosystem II stability/assembly factor-like uncharacterized protein